MDANARLLIVFLTWVVGLPLHSKGTGSYCKYIVLKKERTYNVSTITSSAHAIGPKSELQV